MQNSRFTELLLRHCLGLWILILNVLLPMFILNIYRRKLKRFAAKSIMIVQHFSYQEAKFMSYNIANINLKIILS